MVRNPKPSPVKPADDEVQDMCEKLKSSMSNDFVMTAGIINEDVSRLLLPILTKEFQKLHPSVKERVEEKMAKTFSEFKALSYRTLVDHVNSRIIVFIKVKVEEDSYIHLRIFRIIPSRHGEVELEEILDEKKNEDPLEAFGMSENAAVAVE